MHSLLDGLLIPDASQAGTTLNWLRRAVVANSPKAILHNIERLEFLRHAGVADWVIGGLSPNRLERLERASPTPDQHPAQQVTVPVRAHQPLRQVRL
jgi:hypothetical protein